LVLLHCRYDQEDIIATRWKQAGLILLSMLAVGLASFAYSMATWSMFMNLTDMVILEGFEAFVLVVVYLAAMKWIERRRPAELSLAGAGHELGAGVLAGLALFSLVMTICLIGGAYRLQGWSHWSAHGLATAVPFWLADAIEQEFWWRGLVYRLCAKVFGTWGALLLSTALFAEWYVHGHPVDDTGTNVRLAVGVVMGAALFAAAYAATGRLWLPIGLHFGWNFAEGTLFGTNVPNGVNFDEKILTVKPSGPLLWSGDYYGPQASVVAWIVLIAAIAYLLWRTKKSKQTEPPIWRDPTAIPSSAVGTRI
jgi:membrane protease YdiL (CAAX protease family)